MGKGMGTEREQPHPIFGHNKPLIAATLLIYTVCVAVAGYTYGQNSGLSNEQAFVTEHWKSAAEKYQGELAQLQGASRGSFGLGLEVRVRV